MTIGEAVFALGVTYMEAVVIFVLGAALFITKAHYKDLKKDYDDLLLNKTNPPAKNTIKEANPIKFGMSGLSGKAVSDNLPINIPLSMEPTARAMNLPQLPMSRIIRWFTR